MVVHQGHDYLISLIDSTLFLEVEVGRSTVTRATELEELKSKENFKSVKLPS